MKPKGKQPLTYREHPNRSGPRKRSTAEPFLVGGLSVPAGIEIEPSVPALNDRRQSP